MNRQERERLVVRLRRQGKTYREIAEEARISFSQIKAILDKYGADDDIFEEEEEGDTNTAYLPISSKAYKLFSEGKSPLQVSIMLNLRAPEVQILYKEYWVLRRMHSLVRTYDEIGDQGVSNLLQLHKSCTAQQISNEQVIQYLTIYGNDLPMVKLQYDEVDSRLQDILSQTYRSEKEFEDINTRIAMLLNLLKSIQTRCEKAEIERNNLAIQKLRLLNFISEFKNNNSMFTKIERFVEKEVNMILGNNMKLLELSLVSALKAFKDDPNTYTYLFQKSDFAVTGELISRVPNTNSLSKFHGSNTSLMRANENPMTYSHSHDNLQYHTEKQKPGDYCYACYSRNTEQISRKYFEYLGKEIISDIGLDSFGGMYVAAGTIRQQ